MIFSKDTMQVGGKIALPDSLIAKTCGFDEGEIVEVNNASIKVRYDRTPEEKGKIFAIYTFLWLNRTYGGKSLDDKIPF